MSYPMLDIFKIHDIYIFFQGKSPAIPTYFTNRALCYIKLTQWELACQDCKRGLELDSSLVKGHFFQASLPFFQLAQLFTPKSHMVHQ